MSEEQFAIEHSAILHGPSVPSISLATAHRAWVQVCTTATDIEAGAKVQTRETLEKLDRMLRDHGSDRRSIVCAKVWVRDMNDYHDVVAAWNEWIDPVCAPTWSCRQASMARPEIRVEIRLDAVR